MALPAVGLVALSLAFRICLHIETPPVSASVDTHPIVARHVDLPHWLNLGPGRLEQGGWLISWGGESLPQMAPANRPSSAIGQPQDGIGLELAGQGDDPQGHWRQTFRLTIRPGGTLSDASLVVFGDTAHVNELFEAARQANPETTDPGRIKIGQRFEITVDPSQTYVVRETVYDDVNGVRTTTFHNGVRLIAYMGRQVGVLRVVEFPGDRPDVEFAFPEEVESTALVDETITVKAGERLVDYTYDPADSFSTTAQKIYGEATVKAMQSFIRQSGWDPNHWPPSDQQQLRLIVESASIYADEALTPVTIPLDDPDAAQKLNDLNAQRARIGIYPVRLESLGTVYRVAVKGPSVTVDDVTRLLYNSTDASASIASRAGVSIDTSDPNSASSPLLIGRSFDVYVQYDDERFLLAPPTPDPITGGQIIRLVNGTYIEAQQTQSPYHDGLVRMVHYPSGYKRMAYLPGSLTMDVLDFAYFVLHSESSDMPPERRQALVREFQAATLWDWAPSTPHRPGEEPEWVRVVDSESGAMLDVLIRPYQRLNLVQTALYYLERYPVLVPFALVIVAVAFTAFVTGIMRLGRIEPRRRRR